MSAQIRASHVVGLVNVEDVQVGWEVQHRQRWRKVTLSQSRAAAGRPGGWCLYVAGLSRPLTFIKRSTIMTMAPVDGAEQPPFLPQVPTVNPYADGHNDGKLYLTREQAALLAQLHRTYLPPVFESKDTTTFVDALNSALTRFAEGK